MAFEAKLDISTGMGMQVVEDLCKEVQKEAQVYRDSIRSEAELTDTTGVDLHRHALGSHNRPMVVIKAEKIKHAKCDVPT